MLMIPEKNRLINSLSLQFHLLEIGDKSYVPGKSINCPTFSLSFPTFFSTVTPLQLPIYSYEPVKALNKDVLPTLDFLKYNNFPFVRLLFF